MASRNPFKPSAGSSPPFLVGRDAMLDEIIEDIDNGPGAPHRLTIFTGARGVGKTVMLSAVGDRVMGAGWLVIDETAAPGMVGRLHEHVEHLAEIRSPRPRRRVTGVSVAGLGGVQTTPTPALTAGLRRRVTELANSLERDGAGLLITIDEVHAHSGELEQLAVIAQHLVREQINVALVLAGLPSAVSDLLKHKNDAVLTFMRRAEREVLADVDVEEVADAFAQTFADNGRDISPQALAIAAEATQGYPFLIQLVGYHVWRVSRGEPVTVDHAHAGAEAARRKLGSLVHETALADLSDQDKTFLLAVAQDDGPATMAAVRERMGDVSPQHANTYRLRLLEAGMIERRGHGRVDIALPYLRQYLRDHAASMGLANPPV